LAAQGITARLAGLPHRVDGDFAQARDRDADFDALEKLAEKLTKSIDEGTRPDLIKQAVYLLSI
jgi:hypothetical protein